MRHAKHWAEIGGFLHQRKVFGGHGLQGKFTLAAFEDHLGSAGLQRHGLVGGHTAQNVNQLARTNGGGEVAVIATELGSGANLDFKVAGGELNTLPCFADHDVGQDGQGVAPFNNARNRLQH